MSDSESSPRESFPELLKTGSLLKLAMEMVDNMPARLGPYRILERIGGGGMGIVYLAEQDPPLARRVAIKLARNGISDPLALARFESERQTLAAMNHSGIARIFDAGSTPDARPFFVMEYVAGEPITRFCDSRRLGIEARLELFLRVCDGVQHAHLNAVIHRDVKPGNILVAIVDGSPTPKIIDFGVAKALSPDGARPSNAPTLYGQIVGTPEYMSPEQAALDGRAVDSRTDVYSLGVVLYELLVGGRPFERESGPDDSFVDLCRRIREAEPERPSVRAMRATELETTQRLPLLPSELARRLRGDLDAITIKALAKDPRSRYSTPADMAADIERHLRHQPIHARPLGPLVRLRKAYRRHRAAVTVGGVLSAMLVGLAVVGAAQALRARREAARAETEARIGNEVRKFIVTVVDPPGVLIHPNGRLQVSQLASSDRDALVERIREQFADQPLLQAQLVFALTKNSIASTFHAKQLDTLLESRDRITSLLGPDSAEALDTNENLANTYMALRRFEEAEPLMLDVLDRRRRLRGVNDPETLRTTALLANLYKQWQRNDRAAPLFEAAVAGMERQLGSDDPDLLSTKVGLSGSYLELRRYSETRVILEGAIDHIRRVYGQRNFHTEVALYNLACAHANSGHIELALDYLSQAFALGWGYPYGAARDPQLLPLRADPRFAEIERVGRMNLSARWPVWLNEARWRIREGHLDDAERLLRELISAVDRADQGVVSAWNAPIRLALAKVWILKGRFDEADQLLMPVLAMARAEQSAGDELPILELLAQCDIGRGRRDSALERIAATEAFLSPMYENVERYYATAESQALRNRDEEALESLARAAELGFEDIERLENDLAFEKLRTRAEFRAIVESTRRRAILVGAFWPTWKM